MSKQKAYIVVMFFLGLCVSELHQYWPYKGDNSRVTWFLDVPKYPPTIHWYMKDVLLSVRDIIWMAASCKMAALIDRRLRSALYIFMAYCIFDLLLYFVCYRMYGYTYVYTMTGLFAFIIIRRR